MKNGLILAAFVVLIAAGCSDSASNSAPVPEPVVTSEDVIVVGPITGFGSVIVNGVEFNTDSATVTMDDQPGTPAELRIGMMVSIKGTMDLATGAANAGDIDFFDNAEGPVSGIDHAAGYFFMLGQKVFVDELTMFENATFENLVSLAERVGCWVDRGHRKAEPRSVFLRHHPLSALHVVRNYRRKKSYRTKIQSLMADRARIWCNNLANFYRPNKRDTSFRLWLKKALSLKNCDLDQ